MTNLSVADKLRAARDLMLDEDHWWRAKLPGGPHGENCYCPILAVSAIADEHEGHSYLDIVGFFVAALGLESDGDIANWNDAPERTLPEVHRAFDRAIALAEAEAKQ